jgi:cell division protein YceG involved in septum cleavage
MAQAVRKPRDAHDSEVYVVEVPTGATVADVASNLQRYGLITHAALFRWIAHMQHVERVAPGTYRFRKPMTMREIVTRVRAEPAVATVPAEQRPGATP